MIIAIYTDRYGAEFVATGEDLDEVMRQLEENSGEDNIPPQDVMVVVGEPVKVTKTVTYNIEKI